MSLPRQAYAAIVRSPHAHALIRGLDTLLGEWLKVPVHVAADPLTAVARGTGVVLEDLDAHRDVLIEHDEDFE